MENVDHTMRALHLHVHVDKTLQSFLGKKTDLHMQPRPPIEHVMVKLAAYVMCACVRVCLCTSQPKPSTHRKAISKSQQKFQNDLVAHGNGMTFETPADVDDLSFGAHRPCRLSCWNKQ